MKNRSILLKILVASLIANTISTDVVEAGVISDIFSEVHL